jgi:pyruvate dehydrogenase E1 component alpha subunit
LNINKHLLIIVKNRLTLTPGANRISLVNSGGQFLSIDRETLLNIYKKMLLTREFEEKAAGLFAEGKIHGTTHLYIGEEAVAAGVCSALEPDDYITSTHRGHGHCISKGMDVRPMMAELLGRETGCSKGRGGSMHMADIKNKNLGENGIVGGGCPIAAGAALALKKKGTGAIAVCFFGDGASNEGSFHEAANLASVWKLPVLFVCENNRYGMSMSAQKSMNIKDIEVRAQSYGFPGKTVDGNAAVAVYEETKAAREYVKNNGPMLLVCETYRISGHSKSDKNAYRSKEEIAGWRKKDPIKRLKRYLLDNGFTAEDTAAVEKQAAGEIAEAVEFAEKSPHPSVDTITDNVYA